MLPEVLGGGEELGVGELVEILGVEEAESFVLDYEEVLFADHSDFLDADEVLAGVEVDDLFVSFLFDIFLGSALLLIVIVSLILIIFLLFICPSFEPRHQLQFPNIMLRPMIIHTQLKLPHPHHPCHTLHILQPPLKHNLPRLRPEHLHTIHHPLHPLILPRHNNTVILPSRRKRTQPRRSPPLLEIGDFDLAIEVP